MITLALYVLTACAFDHDAAINSALDELLPARVPAAWISPSTARRG